MKLSGRDAKAFVDAPDLKLSGALIFGEDGVEVARRRARLVDAVTGREDLRLTRFSAADIRRDASSVIDAAKARGFLPGRQAVVVEDAGDGVTEAIKAALADITAEDAFLIVTAGVLPARSKLRKLFEAAKNAVAAPCYADALDQHGLRALLIEAGAQDVDDEALRGLATLARDLDSGAIYDLATRVSLYSMDDGGIVSPSHLAACAPREGSADVDEMLDAVADGKADALGALFSRLKSQGQSAVSVTLAAGRYFRRLHALASTVDAGGSAEAAIGGLRPPVFGPRRDALLRRSRKWRLSAVESALSLILETDDAVRGRVQTADYAVLERALLKIALSARRL
ncbi:MAG: DNA polymerase III subunit delta [Pseudomonadota bacterium]